MNAELTLYDYWRIVNRRKWVALLISEKGRLAQEFLEKYAAMEARLEALKAEKTPKAKKKRGA